jgi:Aerotolerance regulator N-terminal
VFNVIWQSPSVLFGLAAVAAPILIHILVQRRAERVPFPTLRFLQPTRLAAMRRHVLDDALLLAVRGAILAAAVAALAGPLVITAARRQSWERRIVRAVVIDDVAGSFQGRAIRDGARAFQASEFRVAALPDGIRRAVAWLEQAPPARRELVVVSPFPIGSLTAADVAAVPASIGIRFERAGTLPATRSVQAGRVLGPGGVLAREVTLDGAQTSVRDAAAAKAPPWPIEVVHAAASKPSVDAAVAAVLSRGVRAPEPGRRARLLVEPEKGPYPFSGGDVFPIRTPWMADAAARLLRDAELQTAAARVATGLVDARFSAAPWQMAALSADGRPLAVAAESAGRLIVASAAPASSLVTPLLLRSLANGLGVVPDLRHAEVAPIADRLLREWARPSASPAAPAADAVRQDGDENDRRWLWIAVVCLLGIEMGMRRSRSAEKEAREEVARVA